MTDETKTPPTRRALRMNSLRSDGRVNTDLVELVVRDPFTGEELREDDGTPSVVIFLQPLPEHGEGSHEEILRRYTRLEKNPAGGRQLFEVTDREAVANEILERTVARWVGIVGVDDRPLVCNAYTKTHIDERIRVQITRKLFGAEATEVAADSFREPA